MTDGLVSWREAIGMPAPSRTAYRKPERLALLRCVDAYMAHVGFASGPDKDRVVWATLLSIGAYDGPWEWTNDAIGLRDADDPLEAVVGWLVGFRDDLFRFDDSIARIILRRPLARLIELQRMLIEYNVPDVAALVDVPASRWRSWEADRAMPRSDELAGIARVLGMPASVLEAAADGVNGLATPIMRGGCICGASTFQVGDICQGEDTDDPLVTVLVCRVCAEAWVLYGHELVWIPNVGVNFMDRDRLVPHGGTMSVPWRVDPEARMWLRRYGPSPSR